MKLVTDNGKGAIPRDRLIGLEEVQRLTSVKKSTLYLMMKQGTFPRGIQISSRCTRWSEAEVLKWVHDKIATGQRHATPADEDGSPPAALA